MQVTKSGSSVTTLDIEDDILVTGSSDGCVQVYNLETGQVVERLSQCSSMVYQVRIVQRRILITMGTKVTVHKLYKDTVSRLTSKLTHVLTGHSRDTLCVDLEDDTVVSGGLDTNVLVYTLGADNEYQVVQTMTGHKLKVRCVRLVGEYCVSGSWDRCALLWSIVSGHCIRTLKHEMQVMITQK